MKQYCINCKYHLRENGRMNIIGGHMFYDESIHYCTNPIYLISPITGEKTQKRTLCYLVNGIGQCKLFEATYPLNGD